MLYGVDNHKGEVVRLIDASVGLGVYALLETRCSLADISG